METIKTTLFAGRLARGHYFMAGLIFTFLWGFVLNIFDGYGLSVYLLTWALGLVIKSILDAKRLRDMDFSGKTALVALTVFLLPTVLAAIQPSAAQSSIMTVLSGAAFVAQLFLWFKKGSEGLNKYGKPTYDLSLLDAVLNRTEAKDSN